MKRFLVIALSVSLALTAGLAVPANADVAYEVVDLTDIWSTTHPLAASVETWEGTALNNAGDIGGTARTVDGGSFAFVWNEESGFRDLSGIASATEVTAMNELGQVVVRNYGPSDLGTALLWNPSGELIPIIDNSGTDPDPGYITAYGMNDLGHVVGRVLYEAETAGFFWDGSEFSVLHGPEGWAVPRHALAYDVNNCGQVVGRANSQDDGDSRGCQWTVLDSGEWTRDELAGNVPAGIARRVNDSGDVVGTCPSTNPDSINPTLCRWTDEGFEELGGFNAGTIPRSINESGTIVGLTNSATIIWSDDGELEWLTDLRDHAFRWTAADGMQILNDLIEPMPVWKHLYEATAVNDLDFMLVRGRSLLPDVIGSRQFLLRPVPEPSTVSALAAIMFTTIIIRTRRNS